MGFILVLVMMTNPMNYVRRWLSPPMLILVNQLATELGQIHRGEEVVSSRPIPIFPAATVPRSAPRSMTPSGDIEN